MRRTIYVSPHGSTWKVHTKGIKQYVTFTLKREAIEFARDLVNSLPKGWLASIRIQKRNGQFQQEWTYGKDPFPKEG